MEPVRARSTRKRLVPLAIFVLLAPLGVAIVLGGAPPQAGSDSGLRTRAEEHLSSGEYQQALAAFDSLIEQSSGAGAAVSEPTLAELHHGRGLVLVGQIRYRDAALAFEQAVRLDPARASSWSQLVQVRAELGEREGVSVAYEGWRGSNVSFLAEAPRVLMLARALRRAGWSEKAEDLLLEAYARGTPDVPLLLELGIVSREAFEFEKARAYLRRAATTPNAPSRVYYELALCHEALGEPRAAIRELRVALEKAPNYRQARFRLGNLLLRNGAFEEGQRLLDGYEAFRQWDRRVKLLLSMVSSGGLSDEQESDKRLELVRLLVQGGEHDQASQMLRASRERFPEQSGFRLERARLSWLEGKPDEARGELHSLLADDSRSFEVDWLLGRLELDERKLPDAVNHYRSALVRSTSPPITLLKEAGTAFAMGGDLEAASNQFEAALVAAPHRADIHADLALVYEMKKNFSGAEHAYLAALENDPDLVAAQQGLGVLLLARGEAEGALALFEKSVHLRSRDPSLYLSLAEALSALGRQEEAAAARKRADELSKS